jgi:phosphodiesterase/alkaline phosphatase D-like protein
MSTTTRRRRLPFATRRPRSPGNGSCEPKYEGTPGPETLFDHGVASGDPLPDAVILWTRVSVDGSEDVHVAWEISLDAKFGSCTVSGSAPASAAKDFTVKVDATGLDAGTTYYYRFHALGRTSPVGRTRTAPSGSVDRLRFAVVSCASIGHGFFHVYREVSALADIDAVLHLGDYILRGTEQSMAYDVRVVNELVQKESAFAERLSDAHSPTSETPISRSSTASTRSSRSGTITRRRTTRTRTGRPTTRRGRRAHGRIARPQA